jgi:hypothetical protein
MKADEIRKASNFGAVTEENEATVNLLAEIAAQLHEANELKRLEVEAINNFCGVVNLLSHKGHALNKLAGSAESIAVNLDILVNRGRV